MTTNNTNNTANTANIQTAVETVAATPAALSAKEFKQQSFNAYLAYVALMEDRATIDETVTAMRPLMSAYGFDLTANNIVNVLTVRMTAYTKEKGEQVRKVKSITTFRAFVKDGWKEVAAARVSSNAGKAPAAPKTKAPKAKKPTKADLEKELAELRAMLEASAAKNAAADTTTAAETAAK